MKRPLPMKDRVGEMHEFHWNGLSLQTATRRYESRGTCSCGWNGDCYRPKVDVIKSWVHHVRLSGGRRGVKRQLVATAAERVGGREKLEAIVLEMRDKRMTLKAIGADLSLSAERVRNIESRAVRRQDTRRLRLCYHASREFVAASRAIVQAVKFLRPGREESYGR